MAKRLLLAFVALLVFHGVALSVAAAPKSSKSTAFDEWFKTFDPSTAVKSKAISCTGKPNGFYADEPDTCSATYYSCVNGGAFVQTCTTPGHVFDDSVKACVDRYAANSAACETYPTPACTADNLGVYQPTAKCSDLYYICLAFPGSPRFETCVPGLADNGYFDPVTRVCEVGASAVPACQVPPPPAVVPPYGCADKTPTFAYATSTCSVSFYSCASTTSAPTPRSCTIETSDAGTVFDYKATPSAAPVCVQRAVVPECASSFLGIF